MDHTINISFDGTLFSVRPNPLPARGGDPPIVVRPGDTVTWLFDQTVGERVLEVRFEGVSDLNPDGTLGRRQQDTSRLSPFSSLSPGARQIIGEIDSSVSQDINRANRFHYRLFGNGVALQKEEDGGGIDIPRTPP